MKLLAGVWGFAAAGILFKLFWVTCPRWVSSIIYTLMGWMCLLCLPDLIRLLPHAAFMWLLAGGIMYSVGAVIYALHPKKFDAKHIYFGSHEIFHVFIMLGTLCHYILMSKCIVFAS
jgi:hemolysin III